MTASRFHRAIYTGSFDPITLGHLDVLLRTCSTSKGEIKPESHPGLVRMVKRRQAHSGCACAETALSRGDSLNQVVARRCCGAARTLLPAESEVSSAYTLVILARGSVRGSQ